MIRFIDDHKDRRSGQLVWGVEPIAKTLGIAPSTYHASKTRALSARAVRDAELRPVIARVHKENFVAYGADKKWDHLNQVEGMRDKAPTTLFNRCILMLVCEYDKDADHSDHR